MDVSVCMATYNGLPFVLDQVRSILRELDLDDELVIVDDCSNDGTVQAILSLDDSRIVLLQNEINLGVVRSFSKSLETAKGEYIFLSDQDDIWKAGRLALMKEAMDLGGYNLVTSNFEWIDENDNYTFIKYDGVSEKNSSNYLGNIFEIFLGKTNYFGCAMLLNRALVNLIVPIPFFVESHDLWIAKSGNLTRSNFHMDSKTFLKRKHTRNASSVISHRSIFKKLFSRIIFILSIIFISQRIYKTKN